VQTILFYEIATIRSLRVDRHSLLIDRYSLLIDLAKSTRSVASLLEILLRKNLKVHQISTKDHQVPSRSLVDRQVPTNNKVRQVLKIAKSLLIKPPSPYYYYKAP